MYFEIPTWETFHRTNSISYKSVKDVVNSADPKNKRTKNGPVTPSNSVPWVVLFLIRVHFNTPPTEKRMGRSPQTSGTMKDSVLSPMSIRWTFCYPVLKKESSLTENRLRIYPWVILKVLYCHVLHLHFENTTSVTSESGRRNSSTPFRISLVGVDTGISKNSLWMWVIYILFARRITGLQKVTPSTLFFHRPSSCNLIQKSSR